jgi:hypothetical protein
MTGEPVSNDQKLEAARQIALENLVESEKRVLLLAGWVGPFAQGEWRDPLGGVFYTRSEAMEIVRPAAERWAPKPGKDLLK